MKKILAVLFACSIVLAGCMDLTDEDIDAIVDAIVEIPGCNADETAYNYDVNATNNNACLTEMILKNSIADFITLMDNGPEQNQTMGMSMAGSGDMQGQQMDWTSVNVYSPDGSYTSMELDMGMLVWSQSQLITPAADGTILMQVNHNGAQMLMNSATDFNASNNDDMDMGDDDDINMNDNMGMGDISIPEVEIPDSFDPSAAMFEAGLATDNGYSFSTTMDDGMDYSMTMTFTLGMDLVVNSMTLTETMDGESSTSSITMLEQSTLMGYLTIDTTLPYQALPFAVSPMGGMDSGDNDMGDNVDWESYYGGYCAWEGDSGDESDVWYCKDDESDNDWDTWWYYCELHDGDWHCTDDFGQSSVYENSADLNEYDAHEGHDHGDGGDDGTYVNAFLTDNWASSLSDYSEPEFSIYSGFENVDDVQFDLSDMNGNTITTMTIQPMDFTDSGDGNMIYYVDINHLLTDVGCYTLVATVTTHDETQSVWIRDDICNHGDGNDDDDMPMFICANGDEIPFFQVNNGEDDCDGSDEPQYDTEGNELNNFTCMDGSTVWISQINDGNFDCPDGEDEAPAMDDDDDLITPSQLLSMSDTDDSGTMSLDEFNASMGDGEIDVNDPTFAEMFTNNDADNSGDLDIEELEGFILELDNYLSEGHDDNGDDDGPPTAGDLINMTDTDDSGTMSFDEFIAFMNSPDPDGDELPQSVKDDLAEIFNSSDLDESGDLDVDELEQFLLAVDDYMMALEDDEEVSGCTDMYAINYDAGATNDDGSCYYEDSHDGHDDNGNDGHNDHGEHGSMFDWIISNSQDMPIEGSFDDYTIILAMCTMDESSDDEMDMGMGMGTTPTMNCSDDVLSVTIAEALTQDAVVMFHDVDMSGTISSGDMVHISPDVDGDWNMVRLYSTSADAYSDENPMLTPGFTGALGMLALLGAALLTRRD